MGLTLSTHSGTTTPDLSTVLLPGSTTPARGMTAFLPLKEHSVVWSQTLDTVLKFDIDRETFQIMASPLKLVVMQRVIPDDPRGSPQNPRLGAVYLNLAEYVGHGPVERRYLLKESKTNATLKLTIEMDYVSGETHYVPPPLAKGEILNGIAGFLENDIVKKRPRALDIYQEHDEPLKSARVPKTAKSERKVSPSTTTSPDTDSDDEYFEYSEEEDELPEIAESVEVAFDVRRLPVAQGIKTTETLIEALFNPVTTNEKSQETPFTIYEPFSAGPTPTAYGLGLTGIPIDRHATITVGRGYPQRGTHTSRYSTSSSSASVRTTTSDSSKSLPSRENSFSQSEHSSYSGPYHGMRATPEGRVVVDNKGQDESTSSLGGMRGWWKRAIGSRPGTPTAARA
ncbi:hypothetical protein NLJ89_g744 [Agrocybe chaxingu]|uniref:C2 NT-type domain-containing protein n=1 Tax=Agrocybe chaxingu TaxID=84603 RepID=A0A9W8N1D3_9AGAR|nr:hypothetical protein NLJ89_g744 [Agrocybe chaxingu]